MTRRAVSRLISSAFSAALIGYVVFSAMRDWQFARELRTNGVQTDAVVTKFHARHAPMGSSLYDIAYDYAAGGSMHHESVSVMRKPASYEGEHITATFLRDAPESSLPFAKNNIDMRVFDEVWNERVFPTLAIVIAVSLLLYPFVRKRIRGSTP